MPKAIAILWNDSQLPFVVAEDGIVEATAKVAVDAGLDPTAIGNRLAEALASYSPGRAQVVVALSRDKLEWQHLSLPPCPADELTDLVRMQADYDLDVADQDLGFDYLPLSGDEHTPYQVLTVTVEASELAKIREACRAANLTLKRIVPLAAGWPVITQHASPGVKLGTQVLVAPQENEATLWATSAGRVVLFRQFQLGSAEEPSTQSSVMASELRRTLLALSQHTENGEPAVTLVGHQGDQLAEVAKTVDEQLDATVRSLDLTADQPNLANSEIRKSTLPLAGLAIDESQGSHPLVDLLHPHRRPKAKINVRTYALAAAAGVLLLALLGWSGYAKLQAPLNQAAVDQAELTLLEESLDNLSAYEQRAAAIRDWNSEAPNLLLHFQQISKAFRPQALDSKEFSANQDVLLEKLDLQKRQLVIDALARNSQAVQPFEARLRESNYRTQRGKSDPSQTVKEYPWHFRSTIEITTASDHANEPASKPPASPIKNAGPQS